MLLLKKWAWRSADTLLNCGCLVCWFIHLLTSLLCMHVIEPRTRLRISKSSLWFGRLECYSCRKHNGKSGQAAFIFWVNAFLTLALLLLLLFYLLLSGEVWSIITATILPFIYYIFLFAALVGFHLYSSTPTCLGQKALFFLLLYPLVNGYPWSGWFLMFFSYVIM